MEKMWFNQKTNVVVCKFECFFYNDIDDIREPKMVKKNE